MSLSTLNYTKDWTSAEDFPTVQTDENQVRADQQFLFNEIRSYLNDTLIPGIESAIAVACQDLVVGQLTAGSVTKDKLSAALIEVLSRAELGGDLDARINAESAKKVSKSGDTMTGDLILARSGYPAMSLRDTSVGSGGRFQHSNHATMLESRDTDTDDNRRYLTIYDQTKQSGVKDALRLADVSNGSYRFYTLLHEGNLSDLGVPKIATGSYVGTGVYGENNPNSLTFPFVPKVVMICSEDTQLLYGTSYGNHPVFGVLWDQMSDTYENVAGNRYNSMRVKAVGNTMSWYTNATGSESYTSQLNTSGKVYRYIAIG